MENCDKENETKKSGGIPFSEIYKNLNKFKKYICRVIIDEKMFSIGTLLKIEKGKEQFYCLLTCEQLIREYLINTPTEIEIKYNYISNTRESIKVSIKLDDTNRFIKTYKYLGIDAAIVQIFPDKDEIKEEFFFEYKLFDDIVKDNYKELLKKYIHIFYYPGVGDTLNPSTGEFLEIYEINGFLHNSSTESGSSGSPILYYYNNSFIILGIHIEQKDTEKLKGKIDTELKDGETINMGNFIYPIINCLKKDNIIFIKDMFFKSLKFTGDIIENEQKGELYILNNESKKYDKIYVGELSHFELNGKGIIYRIKNGISKEDLSNSMKNKNIEKFKIYCGDFKEEKYNGNGIVYYNNEETDFYKGEFKNNLRNGKGKYYENNKLVYEGEFKDDQYDGKGKLYNENGSYYEGEFIKGKKNGIGKEYDAQGNEIKDEKTDINEKVDNKEKERKIEEEIPKEEKDKKEEDDKKEEEGRKKKEEDIKKDDEKKEEEGYKKEQEDKKEEDEDEGYKKDEEEGKEEEVKKGDIKDQEEGKEKDDVKEEEDEEEEDKEEDMEEEDDNIDNTINFFLDFGNKLINSMGIDLKFECGNCEHTTQDHELLKNNIWKCKKCNKKCKNRITSGLKKKNK